jgi:cytochrome c553
MKRGWLPVAVAMLALAGLEAVAQTPAPATTPVPAKPDPARPDQAKPDQARAQQIVTQVCAACHGAEGVSAAPANPHLAAQHAEYTALQLAHFKSGLRKNPVMMAMAANLTPEEAKSIGEYFATKKPKPGAAKDKALAELGQRIYRGGNSKTGLPACSSCHLPTGSGIPANYPRLAGQFADYTYAQLQGFVRGERGGEIKTAEGKSVEDARGRVMAQVAAKMSEREMRAVAEYISGLR